MAEDFGEVDELERAFRSQAVFNEDGTALLCAKCERFVPLARMLRSKETVTGYANLCTRCANLWRTYRITAKDYDRILARQGGVCAICGKPPIERRFGRNRTPTDMLHIDHDHVTGAVRSLLCGACNMGIGAFKDDPAIMRKAAMYIEEWQQLQAALPATEPVTVDAPSDHVGLRID